MIPSFSRILNNLQSIRYGWASVRALSDEFNVTMENGEKLSPTSLSTKIGKLDAIKNDISLSKISFSYVGETEEVLSGIDLNIKKGETIGLTGESGSGKSTLTNVFLGLLQPSSGEIHIDDYLLNENNVSDWQQMVGYVPQDIYLLDDTLRKNIAFGLEDSQIDDDRVFSVIKMAQLGNLVSKNKSGMDLVLGERGTRLSGGQKQRIGIARALYSDPQFIILDEATSALDNKTENEILNTLKPLQGDKTFLIIAHRQTSLDMCDKVFEMAFGKLRLK
jgi:ABC-type bacteriocin/lantibiotic exporter with double-glycine peptidase domain